MGLNIIKLINFKINLPKTKQFSKKLAVKTEMQIQMNDYDGPAFDFEQNLDFLDDIDDYCNTDSCGKSSSDKSSSSKGKNKNSP